MLGATFTRTLAVAGFLSVAACAGAQSAEDYRTSLRDATAGALSVADAASITVTNEERVNAKWTWKATIAGVSYVCDADDQMRLPSCTQQS